MNDLLNAQSAGGIGDPAFASQPTTIQFDHFRLKTFWLHDSGLVNGVRPSRLESLQSSRNAGSLWHPQQDPYADESVRVGV
jgi:hypothetical protein